ncbi:hypothetical protein OKW21_005321 [Catalinimonas alkaloidigena]|uniref:hypothetical protein n=1 Tax=Catalinimonas alkaloidigena TaxID=1075417 RepID=UPI00240688B4|nr:hypothetical protein [Catalinimonas alkaloidigena]MDF9800058.1 hypothetical protein [Catalinimonas alkaloidigena]
MSYFDKLFSKLFPAKDSDKVTAVHEVLKRNQPTQQAYGDWKDSDDRSELIKEIAQAYYYKKTNITSEIDVHLFNTAYANGFAISYHEKIGSKVFQHLTDYFRDKVLEMGYRLVNADRRILDRENYVETIEKYYLKPPLSAEDLTQDTIQVNQMFGNIAIEHVQINSQPSYLKVLASIYSDRQFQEADSYDDFISALFHQ